MHYFKFMYTDLRDHSSTQIKPEHIHDYDVEKTNERTGQKLMECIGCGDWYIRK